MSKHRWKILFLIVVVLAWITGRSQARGQTTRRTGVVQTVDQLRHTFGLLPDGDSKPVVIEWRQNSGVLVGRKTEFFAGANPASDAILKANIRVQVHYEEALFAANTAVLVRWLKPLSAPHQ